MQCGAGWDDVDPGLVLTGTRLLERHRRPTPTRIAKKKRHPFPSLAGAAPRQLHEQLLRTDTMDLSWDTRFPSFKTQLLCGVIDTVRIFIEMLIRTLPEILNGRKIRRRGTVEETLQLIILSYFHIRPMFLFLALPCPLSPSSSNAKSCPASSHGLITGSRIWSMWT